jgi:hypothetical protein
MPLSRSRSCHDSAGARVEFLFRGCCAAGAGTASGLCRACCQILGAHRDPGPLDVDRAVRQALVGLWVPPAIEELRAASRWDRDTPPKHAG